MFGIGFQEMLIILVVVLIFFGPKRLPDLAKSLGKGIAEFKKASEEVRKGIEDAVKEESAEEAPKPPEDLSAYGKAPGSVPRLRSPQSPDPHRRPSSRARERHSAGQCPGGTRSIDGCSRHRGRRCAGNRHRRDAGPAAPAGVTPVVDERRGNPPAAHRASR